MPTTAGPVHSATSTTVREKASSSAASSTSDAPADSGVYWPSGLSLISRSKIPVLSSHRRNAA